MSLPTGPAKVCTVCGVDCNGRPRTKDARGRYYCKPCYDTAAAKHHPAAEQPSPDPPGAYSAERSDAVDLGFLDAVDQSAAAACVIACPTCGFPLAGGSVLCVNCGHRTDDPSAAVTTTVAKAPKARSLSKERPHIWHIPVGIITIGIALGLLGISALSFVVSDDQVQLGRSGAAQYRTGYSIGNVLRIMFHSMPLIGGIYLLMRNQRAIRLLKIWSWTIIGLHLLGGGCLAVLVLVFSGPDNKELPIAAVAGLFVASAVLSCPWPIFLLYWLHRTKIGEDIAAWRS